MVLGDSGNGTKFNTITFGNGYTYKHPIKHLNLTLIPNTQSVVFNGSIAASSATGDLVFSDYHGATFGSTVECQAFQHPYFFNLQADHMLMVLLVQELLLMVLFKLNK